MKKNIVAILFFYLLIPNIYAQFGFKKTDSIAVAINNKTLKLPWAGGFNYMQFSSIDLNLDGIKDLFAFDKSSNKIITFLNGGIADSVDYKYAPQYVKNFPKNLTDWVLLVDYNCDGKEDIFTQREGSIAVYKNTSNTANGLQFSLVTNKLYSNYYSGYLPLYVTSVDIPSINDIDNDGDVDILTFSTNTTDVELHQNFSKENYNTCDTLDFSVVTACWGDFKEDQSNCNINLNLPCGSLLYNPTSIENREVQHSGSALLAINLDADADKDLLISDIGCSKITSVINGGTLAHAFGTQKDSAFPSYDVPVYLDIFPTPFYVDVNNDGKRDLLASPNTTSGSENINCVSYHKNIGTDNFPQFKWRNNSFLVDEMIDNGEGAFPTFFDYNNDGLLDFVVGNTGRFVNNESKARMLLFKNNGTSGQPKFELFDTDYLGLSTAINLNNVIATFGDLDGDNDNDLLIGNADGKLSYYINNAASGADASFALSQVYYQTIDVGNKAAPQLIDVNRDGKLDLLIGNEAGKIRYFENTGSLQVPVFTMASNFFGGVYTGIDNGVNLSNGACVPQLFDISGTYHLLCGSLSGRIFRYGNIDGNLNGTFAKIDTNYASIWEGKNASISIADINNDGQKDMLIGNKSGGLNYYSGDITSNIFVNELENNIIIYPNPANENVTITATENISKIELYNNLGNLQLQQSNCKNKTIKLLLNELASGIYFVKVSTSKYNFTKKIIIVK